jgi:AraC-like DNA-binding protein
MLQSFPLSGLNGEVSILGGCVRVRRLLETPLVRVTWWRCLHDDDGLRSERQHPWPTIGIEFRGISEIVVGTRITVIDPLHAVAQSGEAPYTTRHPWGCRCQGMHVSIRPDVAAEVLQPAFGADGDCSIAIRSLPLAPADLVFSRTLVRALQSREPIDPLECEEKIVSWIPTISGTRRSAQPSRAERMSTQSAHRQLVDRARQYLVEHYRRPIQLDDIARATLCSPPHLARVFRRETGETLHRHLTRLRLLDVLDRMHEPDADLLALSLENGFCSHSHMTASFRREYGAPPSSLRQLTIAQLGLPNRPGHKS